MSVNLINDYGPKWPKVMLLAQNFRVVLATDRGSSRLFLIKIIFKLRGLGDYVILFFFFFILQNTVLILCNSNDTKKKRKKLFGSQHRTRTIAYYTRFRLYSSEYLLIIVWNKFRMNLRRCDWMYELVMHSSYTHPTKTISFLIEWRSNIHFFRVVRVSVRVWIKNRPIYLDDKANIACWSQLLHFSNRFFVEVNRLK
jgi:hypothetical protein